MSQSIPFLKPTNIQMQPKHSEKVKEMVSLLTSEKRLTILKWIYSDDFEQRHKQISMARVDGSGEWFLRSTEYRNWVRGPSGSVLFCHGMRRPPGNKANVSRSRQVGNHV
jgi:hypothetical protein